MTRPKPRSLGRLILSTSWLAAVTTGCASAAAIASPAALSARASRSASPVGPRPEDPLAGPSQVTAAPADPVPSWAATLLADNVPASAGQAVIVKAPSRSSTTNTVSLWTRTANGWQQTGSLMPGHNGEKGWSSHRTSGDLKTPTGTYTLTAAGGSKPNPGTREPYQHNTAYFHTHGSFLGHSTDSVFDYVVAIDFNRVAGSPVSNGAEPQGPGPGGGIWLHVDNGAATLACVTVSAADMVTILRWLDPSQHPVIVLSAG
ncbi:MAG TPA: L,D-transpeptidase family protein [Streptosporangiaceae bacterium]|nr:L,D-transpeptidase family protein [Streptosporangiaceae bacterium]